MKPKGSLNLIREINTSIILDILKENAPISKYDISKKIHLSAPTVSNIITNLIKVGFVKEVGMGESIGGRPPLLLDLNLEGGFVIGVDIGNDFITSIVVDFLGNIVSKSIAPMDINKSEFIIFDKIISTISDSIKKSEKDRSLFLGMGIGISGEIDHKKGIIKYSSRLKWKNVPLKSIIENSFHLPTFIGENVRLLTYAENWYGAGKDYKNIVCIRVGDDVSAGIIIHDKIYNGSSEKAGVNIGHMTIELEGEKCVCGNRGCLQTLVSSDAIVERTKKVLNASNKDSLLYNYTNNDLNKLTVEIIAKAAKKGDAVSVDIMNKTGKYIAIAVSNIGICLDPELIIIGGGIALSGDVLFNPINDHINGIYKIHNWKFNILPSKLGRDAYAIGAAAVVLHQIFSYPKKFISSKAII